MNAIKRIIAIVVLLESCSGLCGAESQFPGEITLPVGTRITLQLNDYLSTRTNNEGDSFTATVSVPVVINERLVIPKGSTVRGSISRVLRPGRFKGKAIMNLIFQSIQISGRPPISIVASLASVDEEGKAQIKSEGTIEGRGSIGSDAARVLKPSVAGTGIGALAAGGKGAAIGAGVGVAVGLATVFATRGKDIDVQRGTTMDISLDRSLTLSAETESAAPNIPPKAR